MLTVKITQDGVVRINESRDFVFHGKNSDQFNFAVGLIKKLGKQPKELSALFYTQPLFKDEKCTELLRDEEILFSERVTQNSNDLVGVICGSICLLSSNSSDDAIKWNVDNDICESPYLLITQDDNVCVTDNQGTIVFEI